MSNKFSKIEEITRGQALEILHRWQSTNSRDIMGMVAYEMSTTTDMMGLENEEACKCYVEN